MNYSMVRYILSSVLTFQGIFLLLPSLIAWRYGEIIGFFYLAVASACILLGVCGRIKRPGSKVFYSKEGFVTVSLSWILLSIVGALPPYLSGEFTSYTDALFEIVSGLTTTGATVLSDVEVLSYTTSFWRCFTHWIGGMGVLVLMLAVLPLSGSYNMHLMRAESPGPYVGKLVPKVKSTAMILYGIYILITLASIISLMLAGLTLYDSLSLGFSTVGTGGFAILNNSIASYSLPVQIIITIFMLLSAINFTVFYLLLKKKPKEALQSEEMRIFLLIILVATVFITLNIKDQFSNIFKAFHISLFHVVSVITTTGYAMVDYNLWPEFSKAILMALMFVGACAGSSGGGFKVSRLIIMIRSAKNEIISASHPRSVRKVHMNGRIVPENVVKNVQCYLAIYILVLVFSFIIVSLDEFNTSTNFSAVLATLNNIGPGFGEVGPTGNFGDYSTLSKFVFMFDMLIGRLELFPLLVLLSIGIWRKEVI